MSNPLERQILYKRVKKAVPHCNVCGEELGGNGSVVLPYTCSCGEWEFQWGTIGDYIIKVKAL